MPSYTDSLHDTMSYPGTIPIAFKLGLTLGKGGSLADAQEILQAPKLTQSTLDNLVNELLRSSATDEIGAIQRTLGLLSFINFLWALAGLGVIFSTGPFLFYWVGPKIYQLLREFYFFTYPQHDLLASLSAFFIILASEKYPQEAASYIAFFGMSIGLFSYLALWIRIERDLIRNEKYIVNSNTIKKSQSHPEVYQKVGYDINFDLTKKLLKQNFNLSLLLFSVTAAALALKFNSTLFGLISVTLIYYLLAFVVVADITFRYFKDDYVISVTMSSWVIMMFVVGMKYVGVNNKYLAPFDNGLNLYGAIIHYLGMLSIEHLKYNFTRGQVFFAFMLSLLLGLFFSTLLHIASIYNTCIVYVFFFILDFIFQLQVWKKQAYLWGGIFVASVSVFKMSIWLNTHPEFISSLFM